MIRLFTLLAFSFILLYTPLSYSESLPIEQQIADKINQYRIENGLKPLEYDHKISKIALGHAQDLADYNLQQHETPGTNVDSALRGTINGFDYCGDSEVIEKFKLLNRLIYEYNNYLYDNYDSIERLKNEIRHEKIGIGFSENIAGIEIDNPDLAQETFDDWYNSPAHNKGMLVTGEKIGIGIVEDSDSQRFVVVANFC